MLSRESLQSGAYLQSFATLTEVTCWNLTQISASLQQVLAARPAQQAIWLFAYGSLIWNPLIHYAAAQPVQLANWHRSFCVRLVDGRGSAQQPGRMLALQQGGATAGVAFRLDEHVASDELLLVWIREMVHGLYKPVWLPVTTVQGETILAITFVIDDQHVLYEADASIETVAPIIHRATGHLGSNRDYLFSLERTLQEQRIDDQYVQQLAEAVRTLSHET